MKGYFFLIIFALVGISFWFLGFNEPFVGSYAAADTYLGLGAKNYLRYGYLKLKFLPTYYVGEVLPAQPDYYLHHPILQYLLTSVAFKLFGFYNWVVRIFPFIFSLGTLFLIYRIGWLVWDQKTGLLALTLASLLPIMTVFGIKQMMFEHATLFWILVIIYNFLLYGQNRKKIQLILLALFSLLGILTDWGALYLMPGFLIYYLLSSSFFLTTLTLEGLITRPFNLYPLANSSITIPSGKSLPSTSITASCSKGVKG